MNTKDQSRDPDRSSIAQRICALGRQFYVRGWCFGTSGNFSAVLSDRPLRLLITQSGLDKGELTPDDLVVVGPDGEPVEPVSGRPSAETLLHCVVASLTGARAVLHTHSVNATLLGERFLPGGGFSLSGYEMLKGLHGIATHEARVFVPVLENTQDMPAFSGTVRRLLEKHPMLHGFLIAGHGLYTWGRTLDEAQRHVEIFEFLLECAARRTRFEPLPG